jgi:hypothetical protein
MQIRQFVSHNYMLRISRRFHTGEKPGTINPQYNQSITGT